MGLSDLISKIKDIEQDGQHEIKVIEDRVRLAIEGTVTRDAPGVAASTIRRILNHSASDHKPGELSLSGTHFRHLEGKAVSLNRQVSVSVRIQPDYPDAALAQWNMILEPFGGKAEVDKASNDLTIEFADITDMGADGTMQKLERLDEVAKAVGAVKNIGDEQGKALERLKSGLDGERIVSRFNARNGKWKLNIGDGGGEDALTQTQAKNANKALKTYDTALDRLDRELDKLGKASRTR